jgi:hypothetical protein
MNIHKLFALVALTLITPSLVAQTNNATSPTIPEEARRHFVIGTTLFKEAKAPADYLQVENHFKQAVDLAPNWPDARYNLALSKEAAGDYAGAMLDLKIYQQFKLSDEDTRKVQDKIYSLEAKAELAAQKQVIDQQAAAAEEQKKRELDERSGFTDNQNGTVREHRSGLEWQQADDGIKRNWNDSISYCRSLTLAGHLDWRLPNGEELRSFCSLTTYPKEKGSEIRRRYFPSMKEDIYWTSASLGGGYADYVTFNYTGFVVGIDKTGLAYARCIRGGE